MIKRKSRLDSISQLDAIMKKNVLNFSEAAILLGFSESYLYKLTHFRKLPFSKPNNKTIFFNRQELEAWMMSNRIATDAELDIKASTMANL